MKLEHISLLLTEDLIRKVGLEVYQKKYGKNADTEVTSISIDHATSKGEGYIGSMGRVTLTFNDEKIINMIAKGMPANMVRRKTYEIDVYFAREILFFNTILPALRKFEVAQRGSRACADDSLLQLPECYYALSDGDNDFLLLEDLTQEGYGLGEKNEAMDPVQMTAILKVVARLHAFSLAMKEKENENFEKLTDLPDTFIHIRNERRLSKYLDNLNRIIYRAVQDELKDTKYLRKFEKLINPEHFFKTIVEKTAPVDYSVINHGDCWSNNYMFKNGGTEAKAIDFQIVRYGSPILDVSMFIFSCTTEEERVAAGGAKAILRQYYDKLVTATQVLGASKAAVPSFEVLLDQWKMLGIFGLGCAIELVILSLVTSEDMVDLDRMEDTGKQVPLEELAQFGEMTCQQGKKRVADLIKLAVDEGMM